MTNFIQKSLGELTISMLRGITPKYVNKPDENTILVLNQKCNKNFKISIDAARLNDCKKRRVPKDKVIEQYDVLINSTGIGTAGRVAQIFEVTKLMTLDSHMILLRPTNEIDPLYYGYAIKAHQKEIELLAEGSTGQTELNKKRLYSEIIISYPKNINDQKKISTLLYQIDNKIELNNEINNNLLELVFQIYGQIIIGSSKSTLGKLITSIETGKRPKGGAETRGIPSIGAEKIEQFGIYNYTTEKYVNYNFYSSMKKGIVKSSDVLLYKDGAYTGKSSMALNGFPYDKCVVNEHVFILRTFQNMFQSFLYCCLNDNFVKSKIETLASGKAAQPGLNQQELNSIEIKLPSENKLLLFENQVNPLMQLIASNALQNKELMILRDTLLPKLMSGELDVSNIDI